MGIIPARQRPTPARIRLLQFILLILVGIISYGTLVLPLAFSPASAPLQAGDVSLKPETIQQIIALTSARWDTIQQEALSVLEQVMRRSIRDQDVDTMRHSVPSLVSLSLNEDQAAMVAELVTAYVSANSLYNADLTEAAKKSAREAVRPVTEEYKSGEMIVLRGQIISQAEYEALQQFGFIKEASSWQDYAGAGALVIMAGAYVSLYFSRRRMGFLLDARRLGLVAVVFILFLVGARLPIPNRTVLPCSFPFPR